MALVPVLSTGLTRGFGKNASKTMNRAEENINGDPTTLAVQRAIKELRCGRAVDITHHGKARRVAALETVRGAVMARLLAGSPGEATMLVSEHRAKVLGLATSTGIELTLPAQLVRSELQALAGLGGPELPACVDGLEVTPSSDLNIAAALQLASIARLVPALLSVPRNAPAPGQVVEVSAEALTLHDNGLGDSLERISQARVPLEGHPQCELVLYRDTVCDAEHVAVIIGNAALNEPVLVRVHSACLTGDLLGSLRCDCGEQLHSSVERIAAAGGGILLYLAQEGRGIGLANKLRAYALQDAGLDTIDADRHLGFSADERRYQAAAVILRDLGMTRIRLMTNNPAKIIALRAEGIELADHMTLNSTVNPHNERYLRSKRERGGHL